ncbi:interferon a3-like [Hypomesus transpacificus]|uniref:interferon a3-like n=1 Tax=Hypomesus transpacificus TaxID=137520 RepID=UPI001F0795B3|nr:interferon a3-like [Hypomesus transpacificus]
MQGSQCCDWLRYSYGLLSAESLKMLQEMGGDYTEDPSPVPFPESQYKKIYSAEPKDQVRFLNESIYQITRLFNGNMQAVKWDSKKLDDFLNLNYRQFSELKSCVPPQVRPDKNLRRYFRKLNRKVLRKMKHSADAWELIRKETKSHLLRLDIIAAQLRNRI